MDEKVRTVHLFTAEEIARVRKTFSNIFGRSEIVALCDSHERLRMELEAAMKVAKEINDMMATVNGVGSVS